MQLRFYIVAGELSGDAHGADLIESIRALEPATQFAGVGGPRMHAETKGAIFDWTDEAAVVGLWEVIKKYGYFKAQFARRLEEIAKFNPDTVILIDYPGFNLRLAKALKKRNPQLRINYYISPQVWAWNRGRIPKMAKTLDRMLCIFPFEKKLYETSGLPTDFVGHPLVDQLAGPKLPRETNLVGLFPGSRRREIRKHFMPLLRAAEMIWLARPDAKFEFAAASEALGEIMRQGIADSGWLQVPITVTVGKSRELMQRATAGIVASGTATLEAACFRMPFVIIYKVHWLTWIVGKALVDVRFLGMVNLLAGREVAREFLQGDARPEGLSDAVIELLNFPEKRAAQVADLDKVARSLGEGGASGRAARTVIDSARDKSE